MPRTKLKTAILIVLFSITVIGVDSVLAGNLFGPAQYLRTRGKPNFYTAQFRGANGEGLLRILNGSPDGTHRVTSAHVYVNGKLILKPNAFKKRNHVIEKSILLTSKNKLEVELRGVPGKRAAENFQG